MLFLKPFLLLAVTLLVPFAAMAQAVTTDAGDTVLPMWAQFAIGVGSLVGGYVVKVFRTYLGKLGKLAAEKTKLAFLDHVDDIISAKVMQLWQDEVKLLKDASADGVWTSAEKKAMQQKAIDWAKSFLDASMLVSIFTNNANADKALGNMVDRAVVKAKIAGKIAKAADPSKP